MVGRGGRDIVGPVSSPETSKLHFPPVRLRHMSTASPCLNELSVQCAEGLSEKPSRFAQIIHKSSCDLHVV